MAWVTPKVNFTASDFYTYQDLNRVEANTQFIDDLISTFRTRPPLETVITNRDIKAIEYYDSLNRLERNIQSICNNFYTPSNFLGSKTDWRSGQYFDFNEANRLEINLLLLFNLVQNSINAFVYCNQYTCGGSEI